MYRYYCEAHDSVLGIDAVSLIHSPRMAAGRCHIITRFYFSTIRPLQLLWIFNKRENSTPVVLFDLPSRGNWKRRRAKLYNIYL